MIELGSMYHMLEPLDFSAWSVEETATEAELLMKGGRLFYCSTLLLDTMIAIILLFHCRHIELNSCNVFLYI